MGGGSDAKIPFGFGGGKAVRSEAAVGEVERRRR
jgi:hypothetical protein